MASGLVVDRTRVAGRENVAQARCQKVGHVEIQYRHEGKKPVNVLDREVGSWV